MAQSIIGDNSSSSTNNRSSCTDTNPAYYVRFHTEVYGIGFMSVVGLALNVLTVVVLGRLRRAHRSVYALWLLAMVDAGFLVTVLLSGPVLYVTFRIVYGRYVFNRNPYQIFPGAFRVLVVPKTTLVAVRNWMTVLVQLERLFIIVYPLKAPIVLTSRRLMLSSVWMTVIFFVSHICLWSLAFEINPFDDYCITPAFSLMKSSRKVLLYFPIIQLRVINTLVPVFLTLLADASMLIWLFANRRHRLSLLNPSATATPGGSAKGNSQTKATVTVIYVCTAFIILEFPNVFIEIVRYATKISVLWPIFYTIGGLTTVLNSCINFFIYAIVNKNFRQKLPHAETDRRGKDS
ncbi:putative G-protein coupled receptor F59B2.13 [Tubulanus polymorphus]|uniref:putative G-protein coupled receptor F59B2.13 n=1 Tax=Tubulanus polymorphus TaxID=672921 RepID=UPI003DA34212